MSNSGPCRCGTWGWRRITGAVLIAASASWSFANPPSASPDLTKTRGVIPWRSDPAETTTLAPADSAKLVGDLRAAGFRHFVIQFEAPVTPAQRQQLADAGVKLLSFVGDNAYFASASDSHFDPAALTTTPNLRNVLQIRSTWKLHPDFITGEIPDHAIIRAGAGIDPIDDDAEEELKEKRREMLLAPGTLTEEDWVAAYVAFHPDVSPPEALQTAFAHGAWVRSYLYSVNAIVVEIPLDSLLALVEEDGVQWAEPPLPRISELNAENRAITGVDVVQAPPYSLTGAGVTVLVYDGGTIRTTHVDFQGRAVNGDTDAVSSHATHVSGTVGGAGVAVANNRGMAPGVNLVNYGFETGGPLMEGFLYTDPGDLEADYGDAINNRGADISNNSIGTNTAPNNFNCLTTGNYGITDTVIDSVVRGSVSGGVPFRIVWANGNERQVTRCLNVEGFPAPYHSTSPPACAKNHITVGASDAITFAPASFTSYGPCDDGRIKPDLMGPGVSVISCTSTSDTAYATLSGTSMSSPTVCGISALVLQDYRVHYPGEPDFRNSTLKSLLAHSAGDQVHAEDNRGPDFKFGYGYVNAPAAVDLMRSGNWLEESVDQGQVYSVIVFVNPGDPSLKVTLAWDDPPGTPNVSPALVNDLDLHVYDASNNRYFPWTLAPFTNPGAPAVRTQEDHLNNIEQVEIDNPAPGAYRIEVRGFNVPQGPQPFSLVGTPQLINCSSQGVINLDRSRYACESTATIRVVDCDLNTDDGVIETVVVTITSSSEPAGESVLLTETAPESATFLATINLSQTNAPGVLLIAPGDMVTATYNDADDGSGQPAVATAQATVDCTAPVISNVQTSNVLPRNATITFSTDEPAATTVRYGTSCGALNNSASATGLNTSHTFNLSNLNDDTQYFFAIDAVDAAGNSSTNDNGGSCFTFTTPEVPEFFTEQFTSFDLHNTSLLLVPNGTIDFYGACVTPAATLPTDPAGGTTLTFSGTNAFASVPVSVSHYGVQYPQFFVGTNGYITFLSGDTASAQTIALHFNRPRISALFDNLNPTAGGSVSYKVLGDRVAVTWLNVPENATTNQNTFQVEMFFDGSIQITWLNIASNNAIVGLSPGGGIPPDFFQTDIAKLSGCGPRPPSAGNQTVSVPQDRPRNITLFATDDGTPGPLVYIITALPTHSLRDAGNGQLITTVPYTLSNNGNEVIYQSSGGFVGPDGFQFQADDGGTPPDGGASNAGTINVIVQPVLDLPFSDNFPTTTFDANKWAEVNTATIDGLGIAEPSEPFSARFDGNPSGGDSIVTHLIDLSAEDAVRLSFYFQQTGGGEPPDANDDLFVEYQDAQGAWQELNRQLGSGPNMTTYQQVSMLLPPGALHNSFRLRIRNTATVGAFDDWFVDDLVIVAADAPEANGVFVAVRQNTSAMITLNATDPNMDPLTYVIESLPVNGSLADPNGGPITTTPYALLAGGNQVHYTPMTGFLGLDGFNYSATDGEYGSNVAAVSIEVAPVLDLPFTDEFPSTTFDPVKWSVVDGATIDDVGLAEPSPPFSARFNGTPDGSDELISHLIDLSPHSVVNLSYAFQQRGGGESPDAGDDLFIEFLNSSGNWQLLQQHLGSGPDMTTYQVVEMTLPPAALHSGFRLRIRNTATTGAFDDWFVDDVRIIAANAPIAMNVNSVTPANTPVDIILLGSDPNMDPLSYVVSSLPADGQLSDPNAGTIGSVPYTLAAGGDTVRYTPALGFNGNDGFSYFVTDGQYNSNVASVSITVGGPQPIYVFSLDANPGWTTVGQWAFGQPTGMGGSGRVDPTGGFTGINVYGYNLNGHYPNNMTQIEYLTTTALDFTGVTGVELRFRRWLGVESSTFDHANIQVSNNGTTWVTVWDHVGPSLNELAWSLQTYDISAVADDQATVFIRWGMGPTDGSVTYHGWNIDDVEFWGFESVLVGDMNCDGIISPGDIAGFVLALTNPAEYPNQFPGCDISAADVNGDGVITPGDIAGFVALLTGN